MTTTATTPTASAAPAYGTRQAAMETLAPLVGTWEVSGDEGVVGRVRFEWLGDRAFLVQHVALLDGTDLTEGVEYIGYDADRGVLASHFFGFGEGQPLEYVWEVTAEHLTIWFGDVGSPARYRGGFTEGGRRNTGAWEWPGGGYASAMRRLDEPGAA